MNGFRTAIWRRISYFNIISAILFHSASRSIYSYKAVLSFLTTIAIFMSIFLRFLSPLNCCMFRYILHNHFHCIPAIKTHLQFQGFVCGAAAHKSVWIMQLNLHAVLFWAIKSQSLSVVFCFYVSVYFTFFSADIYCLGLR